jgi:hypothetical protein
MAYAVFGGYWFVLDGKAVTSRGFRPEVASRALQEASPAPYMG